MTTKELIDALQKCDPAGTATVLVNNEPIDYTNSFHLRWSSYDGHYYEYKNKKLIQPQTQNKMFITTTSEREIVDSIIEKYLYKNYYKKPILQELLAQEKDIKKIWINESIKLKPIILDILLTDYLETSNLNDEIKNKEIKQLNYVIDECLEDCFVTFNIFFIS